MKRFVVIGLGNFGSAAAESLHRLGHDVIVVDRDPDAVDRASTKVTRAAVGDGTSVEVLERIGGRDADAGVVSTGDDITSCVLATLALKDCGVEEVYVKVISLDHARVMEKLGVTETVFPERDSAVRLAKRISNQKILNFVELGPGFHAQEMAVPDSWAGKSLRELELPRRFGISVIAVHDYLSDVYSPIPDPDGPLKDSDTLLVAGSEPNLAKITRMQ